MSKATHLIPPIGRTWFTVHRTLIAAYGTGNKKPRGKAYKKLLAIELSALKPRYEELIDKPLCEEFIRVSCAIRYSTPC